MNFVIISYPRTGSTYLVKALNSDNKITCHSEIFHKDKAAFNRSFLNSAPFPKLNFLDKIQGKTALDKLYSLRGKDPIAFLNQVYSTDSEAIGFKIFPEQNDQILNYLIEQADVKKIILTRENLLRSYTSEQLAIKSGNWDRTNDEQLELETLKIDFNHFLDYQIKTEGSMSYIRNCISQNGQVALNLTYEEITHEFPFQKISDYLKVTLETPEREPDQIRQKPYPLSSIISNYSEIEEQLVKLNLSIYLENE